MKVRAIRGSIMYDGTVYPEGSEFEIEEKHLPQMQENVEVLDGAVKPSEEERPKATKEPAEEPLNEDPEEVAPDYSKMKKEELLSLAQERGIEVPTKAKTAEIIELLEGAE